MAPETVFVDPVISAISVASHVILVFGERTVAKDANAKIPKERVIMNQGSVNAYQDGEATNAISLVNLVIMDLAVNQNASVPMGSHVIT